MFDINELWWSLCSFLLQVIDGVSAVFYWLAGIRPATVDPNESYVPSTADDSLQDNIFVRLWNTADLSKVFVGMAIIGLFLLAIALFVGLMKAQIFQQDSSASTKKVLGKSAMNLIWIIAMPLLYFVAIIGVSALLNVVVSIFSLGENGTMTSLGEIIGRTCVSSEDDVSIFRTNLSYNEFKECNFADSYNYFLCIASGACCLVGLAISCFLVVERILHIFLLYVVSPLILSKTPLDDGKSMEQWRDLVLSKFLGIIGVVSCMYLFFLLIQPVNSWLTPDVAISSNHSFYLGVAKLIFLIGGVFAFTKAGHLFAHLIAQGSGQFEGMSQAQTMGLLSMGGKLAGGIIGGMRQGGRMFMAGGLGGGSNQTMGMPPIGGRPPLPLGGTGGGAVGGSSSSGNGAVATSAGNSMASAAGGATGTSAGNSMASATGGAAATPMGESMASATGGAAATPMGESMANVAGGAAATSADNSTPISGAMGQDVANNKQGRGAAIKESIKKSFSGGMGAGYAMMYGGIMGVAGYALAKGIKGVMSLSGKAIAAVSKGIIHTPRNLKRIGQKISQYRSNKPMRKSILQSGQSSAKPTSAANSLKGNNRGE